jgi:hypothetical protein
MRTLQNANRYRQVVSGPSGEGGMEWQGGSSRSICMGAARRFGFTNPGLTVLLRRPCFSARVSSRSHSPLATGTIHLMSCH